VALENGGIAASKEADPGGEGHWQVSVGRDDASAALGVLNRENLPPPASPGVLDALGQDSIVPSRTAEHAKLVAGTAGDLERSIRAVEGVLSARVHLAIPPKDAFALEQNGHAPTASVLIRHRGATPPISEADVRRLVAGAVPGLAAEKVSVVATPIPPAAVGKERELARFGPLTLTRSSMLPLRVFVGVLFALYVVLFGLVLLFWSRMKKSQQRLAEARAVEGSRQDDR
jgi:type III secretion protein J